MKKLLLALGFLISTLSLLSAQGKIKADYYNGINFERYVGTDYVSKIDFYWERIPPLQGVEPDNCSVLYTGQIKTPRSGTISFHAEVDDGIMVWVDDKLIISNWQLNDMGVSQGKIDLLADTNYNIRVKYFNAMNEAELKLFWKLPEDPKASWFKKLWEGDGHVIIPAKFFLVPVEKKALDVGRA